MKAPKHQFNLELIPHRVQNAIVDQRASDGYINATALCSAAGKHWHNYIREETNGSFLRALSLKTQIGRNELVQTVGSHGTAETVWVHPKVAVHLGQWLSAEFAVRVSEWVYDWMSGAAKLQPKASTLPPHLERHMLNYGKVPVTHFSILQELTTSLIAPLEAQGYSLPADMVPDISQGRMFCKFAREELGLDTNSLPTYEHEYPDGRNVPAKLYPVEHLGAFRTFINEVWMPQRAEEYFRMRDPQALPMLDRVLRIGHQRPRLQDNPKPHRQRRTG